MDVSEKHAATYHGSETHAYLCELCGTDRGTYAAMMQCELECYEESVASRKGHVSPKLKPTGIRWEDE